MGFFKSVRDRKKQAKETDETSDPGSPTYDSQTRMANLSEMLAERREAATSAAQASGVDITVTITRLRQVGVLNTDPMMEFDLTAMPDGLPPYTVTAQQTVTEVQLVQLRPGTNLQAKVDPNDPSAIWLDMSSIG